LPTLIDYTWSVA